MKKQIVAIKRELYLAAQSKQRATIEFDLAVSDKMRQEYEKAIFLQEGRIQGLRYALICLDVPVLEIDLSHEECASL